MTQPDRMQAHLRQIRTLPVSWLYLSLPRRIYIISISYILGIAGLFWLFPLTQNGAAMFLPIVSACWLFRYRGLIVSMILNGLVFQLAYSIMLHGLLPDQKFVLGGIIGFSTSLALGVVVCWLRVAVDMAIAARQRASAAERDRMQALQAERQAALAYEQQRKINELKDHFMLNVSHELRTPLTMLGGSLDLLGELGEAIDPDTRTQLLEEARTSHDELVELVKRVLYATTMAGDTPQTRPEYINLHQLLQDALAQSLQEKVNAYTFHLQVSEQLRVWADRQLLERVLHNLLSNIFKYVPEHTSVYLQAEQATPSAPILLSVQDSGPGIPPEELPLLFEKFVRLKRDIAGQTSGLGLGLYFSKRFTEAMQGHIWIESSGRPHEGCRLCMSLPAIPEPVHKKDTRATTSSAFRTRSQTIH